MGVQPLTAQQIVECMSSSLGHFLSHKEGHKGHMQEAIGAIDSTLSVIVAADNKETRVKAMEVLSFFLIQCYAFNLLLSSSNNITDSLGGKITTMSLPNPADLEARFRAIAGTDEMAEVHLELLNDLVNGLEEKVNAHAARLLETFLLKTEDMKNENPAPEDWPDTLFVGGNSPENKDCGNGGG